MRTRSAPLLCELHAHTTWSDGALSLRELVDLYGGLGFDAVCVTDHTCRTDDPWLPAEDRRPRAVHAANYADYLAEVEREAVRARERYDLLLLPGLELTWNDLDPLRAAHALALGLRTFVSVDDGLEAALAGARAAGAAIVAAHPFADDGDRSPARTALQPFAPVPLGRGGAAAVRRLRRLPSPRAPRRLEDARPLREGRENPDRAPPLRAAGYLTRLDTGQRIAA